MKTEKTAKEMKTTPGPWEAIETDGGGVNATVRGPSYAVATVLGGDALDGIHDDNDRDEALDERNANAALIAAAPDLLAAALCALAALAADGRGPAATVAKLRAAIARAVI